MRRNCVTSVPSTQCHLSGSALPYYIPPMRFALITDVHFGPPGWHEGKLRKLPQYAEPLVLDFVDRMNRVERPELVINLGDVIEDDTREADKRAYAHFIELLGDLEAPVLHVAGNHESVNLDDNDLGRLWGHEGPLFYSRDVGGIHFSILRTEHRRATEVRLPQSQLKWLAEDLRTTTLPCVVLLHHPLGPMDLEGNPWFEKTPEICFVAEREQARQIIAESHKVIGVFNGHVHWNHLGVVAGVPYVTLQSLTENVDEDAPGRPARSLAIVDVSPSSLKVRIEGEHPARYHLGLDA